jgi:hypothetical protein
MKKTLLFSVLLYLLSVNLFAQNVGINADGSLQGGRTQTSC